MQAPEEQMPPTNQELNVWRLKREDSTVKGSI
jgi:hypothetical protein